MHKQLNWRGPSGFVCLGEVCRQCRWPARAPGCPGAQGPGGAWVPGCPGAQVPGCPGARWSY
eukprot:419825-Pyramimonas_sp.AAC.1